jgi:2-dehydro-3-deoxyphosphooctonate aldolase (KDO 8-P synthase)
MPKKAKPFFLIAGPCVIEGEAQTRGVARKLKAITDKLGIPFVFKASYDKANRSSVKSYRGPGLEAGLKILGSIRRELGCRVLTDVHSEEEAVIASEVIDILQIPAFLCRQTDLILAAARTGRTVNVKKGQFLAPEDMDQIALKLKSAGCRDYFFTERGSTFGYHNLVVDMRALSKMRAAGHRVVFDATHSVQEPGGKGTHTGGDAASAPVLARAATAVGVDGLFIETHPRPGEALSDGPNMIPLAQMEPLLRKLKAIHEATIA